MKKRILTGVLIFTSLGLWAQNKFSLILNTQIGTHPSVHKNLPISEYENHFFDDVYGFSPTIRYGGGLSINYNFSDITVARLGIEYLRSHEEILEYNIYGGAHDVTADLNSKKLRSYHQLQIPLTIIKKFGQGRYRPFGGGGILINQFFRSKKAGIIGLQKSLLPRHKIHPQMIINAGLSIQEKLSFELQYTFGRKETINTYSELVPFPCAVSSALPIIGPCANHLNIYSQADFGSFLSLKIGYQLW